MKKLRATRNSPTRTSPKAAPIVGPSSSGQGSSKARPRALFMICCLGMALYRSEGKGKMLMKMAMENNQPRNVSVVSKDTTSTTAISSPESTKKEYQGTGGIFFCGYENFKLASEVFPDYMSRWWGGFDNAAHQNLKSHHPKRLPTKDDILVMGMHGDCGNNPRSFPGKALFVNGEPNGDNMPSKVQLPGRALGQDVYQIGLLPDSPHSVQIFHGAWNLMRMDESLWSTLWDPARKPKNSGKHKGLMYMNRQCHQHREEAVNRIANIMTVYYGGRCKGNAASQPDKFRRMPHVPTQQFWIYNRDTYSEYTFCFAMENSLTQHYLSEKIILAFLAGCVPVYYGSNEVFDVFNKDAFVFYDPQNPEPALNKLRVLAQNETAYQETLAQPLMAHGEETVRKYFSVSDRIGGGYLKGKLRKTMGLPE